ncbi:RsmB/NOP family class I SAM-dependent RNA methyltransferase [Neochlamydia sp. S13]|uniref:RsmB/NOP family class I SAM-dependent RNA methyltransferase n=1 Tax=Neochlamydia sp. S13 TaxID=1353976 RepID=UPI0005AAA49E|nr:RsmB/NOP family class I SAM-dependent RNA methyltransferase [Neochlamydia sp. S13]BBI17315.1 Putative 16S rRNA m5C967 SAM-dependent methyltransferase [Neochlamydia sp. S13]
MKQSFRAYHLLQLLSTYDEQNLPLDAFINSYFRSHKALGSKDRAFIAENAYFLIRWIRLIDYLIQESPDWNKRVALLPYFDWQSHQNNPSIPAAIRVSFPDSLYNILVESYGALRASELCLVSNTPAPTTIRANTLKATRDKLLELLQDKYEVSSCLASSHAINFLQRINFLAIPEFQAGLFEVQDEGSQLLANLVQCQPGQLVMDFCAGSGGKTLALAPSMQNKGQIFLHDIRSYALQQAKKRLKRAGIHNGQIMQANDPKLKKLKKKMDWVLVDAPCSGTGTLRRNPDMKWRFEIEGLKMLIGQQRTIFEKALSFMKPDGRIIYGTCSLLSQENEYQLKHFIKSYHLKVENQIFQSFPSLGGMDGFFGVVLKF